MQIDGSLRSVTGEVLQSMTEEVLHSMTEEVLQSTIEEVLGLRSTTDVVLRSTIDGAIQLISLPAESALMLLTDEWAVTDSSHRRASLLTTDPLLTAVPLL